MILFFYGEDNYRLKQKIKALKEKFISASLGDTNLSVLDGKIAPFDEIVRQILAMPFLARSRLIIIDNLIKEGKPEVREKIVEFLPKIPSSSVVVFVEEGMPDKRTSLFKKLNQPPKGVPSGPKTSQEFKLLDDIQLRRWIKKEVDGRGGVIAPEAIDKLIEYVGNDLWRQSNELDKLKSYNKKITSENIELLVKPQVESNIFDLVDAIGQKNFKKATQELQKLLDNGENELYILSMIVYQYRNLLILKDLYERGEKNKWVIAKKSELHPFVVQKTLAQLGNFTIESLKKSYATLLDFDVAIKTGKMESKTALNLLIAKFCV